MERDVLVLIPMLTSFIPNEEGKEFAKELNRILHVASYRAPEEQHRSWEDLTIAINENVEKYHSNDWFAEILSKFTMRPKEEIQLSLENFNKNVETA